MPRIGIDLLGSDTSPAVLLKSVLELYGNLENKVELTLFGTEEVFSSTTPSNSIKCISVKEYITMEDDPLIALRRKKESSLCIGMQMLHNKELDAFISAGNTGAIMASAVLTLSPLPNIERPALLTVLPTKVKDLAVLDVGANVSFTASQLLQFASMGIAYQKSRGVRKPSVGLLNIGVEAKKGTPELREAYQQLQLINESNNAFFIGNIEGRDVFQGNLDVLVTDGFTGNIFLKTAEGIAGTILDQLEEYALEECSPGLKEMLSLMRERLYYAEYPGAILCGIDGIVIKCHGNSNATSLIKSVEEAIHLIQNNFLPTLKLALK